MENLQQFLQAFQPIQIRILLPMLLRTSRLIKHPDQTKPSRFSQPLARHVGRGGGQVKRETGHAVDQCFKRRPHITFARILGIGPVADEISIAAPGFQANAANDRMRFIVDDNRRSPASLLNSSTARARNKRASSSVV